MIIASHCCRCGHTQTKNKNKKKCLPQLVPLLCARGWSEAVAATVFFDVLGNVLPGQLGATTTVVRSFRTAPLGVGDSTAEESNLSNRNQYRPLYSTRRWH